MNFSTTPTRPTASTAAAGRAIGPKPTKFPGRARWNFLPGTLAAPRPAKSRRRDNHANACAPSFPRFRGAGFHRAQRDPSLRRREQSSQRRLDRRLGLDRAAGSRRPRARFFRQGGAAGPLRAVSRNQSDAERADGARARLRDDPAVHRRRGDPRPAGEDRRRHHEIERLRDRRAARDRQRQSAQGQTDRDQHLQLLSRNGLDPNKDVTLQAVAGSPDARFAALVGGSVDATVVNSPFEYRAEQKGFRTLLSVKETAEFVHIPIAGVSTTQRKIEREPDEIVRYLRAERAAILFLQNQREVGVGLIEKLLKLDRPAAERFYGIYRDQYNPDLTVPDAVVEEWIAVGTFRAKEKITAKPQVVYDWSFAERARR